MLKKMKEQMMRKLGDQANCSCDDENLENTVACCDMNCCADNNSAKDNTMPNSSGCCGFSCCM